MAKRTRKTKPPKLSKASTAALEAFDEAARDWGLTQEWGTGSYVDRSKADYNGTKLALQRRIAALERALKRAKT